MPASPAAVRAAKRLRDTNIRQECIKESTCDKLVLFCTVAPGAGQRHYKGFPSRNRLSDSAPLRRRKTVDHDNSVLGLASIRRNRGLSLEQIAGKTKISLRALQAIEAGEFKKLPGGVYNTSYIRQYAQAI